MIRRMLPTAIISLILVVCIRVRTQETCDIDLRIATALSVLTMISIFCVIIGSKARKISSRNDEQISKLELQNEIIENMNDGVSLIRVGDDYPTFISSKLDAMLGYQKGELEKTPILQIRKQIAEEAALEELVKTKLKAIQYGQSKLETRCKKKDGTYLWVSLSVTSFNYPTKGLHILCIWRDIDKKKKISQSLELAELRYRSLFENSLDAILVINQQNTIILANKKTEHLFDYERHELIDAQIELLLPAGQSDSKQFGRKKNGSEIEVEIFLNPVRTEEGILNTIIIRDISEINRLALERKDLLKLEKDARIEAERANEVKDVFLATLSHELRTPLTSILSWSQLLRRNTLNIEKVNRGLEIIEKSANTQAQMINDFLDISRIQSGKLALTLTEVPPAQTIHGAIESLKIIAENKKITIEVIDHSKNEKIKGDVVRLQQIFWNLLTNSIKFSPKGSQIQVSLARIDENERSFLSVRVIDSGKGIEPDFLPYIFTRFSQQDSTSTRIYGGLGIGLALVRDLVKAHHGSVRAESPGPEKGATFTVLLPLTPENEVMPAAILVKENTTLKLSRPNLSGIRVLILDDQQNTLEVFAEIVKNFGGEPATFGTAQDALIGFEKFRPHVIASDIAMPLEDGYSFIEKIRALPPEQGGQVPAIALTAYAAHHDIVRSLAAGYQEHMSKPLDDQEFGDTIARLARGIH